MCVTLHGSRGSSAKTQLSGPFDRGSVVTGRVSVNGGLGSMERMEVEHDNTGFAPDWFLEKVLHYYTIIILIRSLALEILS